MESDFSIRKPKTIVVGSAGVFALAFWLLDAGNTFWSSGSGVAAAIVPEGSQFVSRLLYAALFAVAGWIAGAAVLRSRATDKRLRDRLNASERKYKTLEAAAFDSVLTVDKHAQIVDASDSAAALLGASLPGTNLDDYFDMDGGADTAAANSTAQLFEATDGQPDHSVAATVRGRQGRVFPAEVRITPMPAGDDNTFLVAIRETTASLVAQKASQHSERQYRAMFDNVPVGIYRGSADGRLLSANRFLANMLGYANVDDLLAMAKSQSIFLDLQDSKALVAKLERHGNVRNFKIRLRCRDNSSVMVLANILATGHAIHDGVVYEGILTDISDLEATHEALQDSEEYFRELCEHSLDVITVIDPGGVIRYSSPSSKTLSSHSPDEQVGLSLLRNVHPDDEETVRQIIIDGFERPGTAQHFTCRVFRDDGSLRHIDAVGTAFMTRRGHLRAVIHSRDVTDEKAALGETGVPKDEPAHAASPAVEGSAHHE